MSPLFSIDNYPEIIPHVRAITAEQLDAALTAVAKIPLPDADTVFPWLHGIHPSNPDQRYFFSQPRGVELPPPSTYRGIALVAAHSREQNRHGRLVGSIEANDLFQQDEDSICFVQPDPLKGVSLRNFHIQARKIAMLSDIVIYDIGSGIDSDDTLLFASCVADAQRKYRNDFQGQVPEYHTFIVSESFAVFEETYPSRVAQDSTGKATRFDMDFLEMERTQMCVMSRATEIAQNVYMGSTADWDEDCTYYQNGKIPPAGRFSIHIRCEDYVLIPSVKDNELRLDDDPDHVVSREQYSTNSSLRYPFPHQDVLARHLRLKSLIWLTFVVGCISRPMKLPTLHELTIVRKASGTPRLQWVVLRKLLMLLSLLTAIQPERSC